MIDDKATSQKTDKSKKTFTILTLLTIAMLLPGICTNGTAGSGEAAEKFDRSQSMLINLKSAPMSAGYFIIHSYSASKVMARDLDKALNQVVEVDKTYAKSRHKPDNRYLENACLKITVARQTAEQLKFQLSDAYSELKDSIEETMVTDSNFH